VAFGITVRVAFGAASGKAPARKNAAADKPLPNPLGLFTS